MTRRKQKQSNQVKQDLLEKQKYYSDKYIAAKASYGVSHPITRHFLKRVWEIEDSLIKLEITS